MNKSPGPVTIFKQKFLNRSKIKEFCGQISFEWKPTSSRAHSQVFTVFVFSFRCTSCHRPQMWGTDCTVVSDRKCQCPKEKYMGQDLSCNRCMTCGPGQYMVKDCTDYSNRRCASCRKVCGILFLGGQESCYGTLNPIHYGLF